MGEVTWLAETPQLDISDPKLRITAQKLTQARQSIPARAAAIHDFVRRLPFAATADSGIVRASEVLRRGRGDCHSKGVLFTALCRAAGLPARLAFVDVRPRFLAGILDGGPEVMPHAVGQVLVDGEWRSTDGYVVDPVLFAKAKALLSAGEQDCGWGIVRDARGIWDGRSDSMQQFHEKDVLRWHGHFHDPSHFYVHARAAWQGWAGRLKYAVGTRMVNHRVEQLRAQPA